MQLFLSIVLMLQFILFSGLIQKSEAQNKKVQIANLNSQDSGRFNSIREAFKERNPGYDITYFSATREIEPQDYMQVMFVQEIAGVTNQDVKGYVEITGGSDSKKESEAIVGDILILEKGEKMRAGIDLGLLVFKVPKPPENNIPAFIRPDWDPNVTDVPGGCATDIDAYRRILLTWKEDVGEYIYHAINAHRVRIRDSFSHYHPEVGGFDEFYLVQMVEPGAKIITSEQTELITHPEGLDESQTDGLIQEYELETGDLVYLPRGVTHRGYGGVVTQVITVPGFIPGSEIGVDHHLRAINERLNLNGNRALPYNQEASEEEVIR